jgi:translation initiation factor IF-2
LPQLGEKLSVVTAEKEAKLIMDGGAGEFKGWPGGGVETMIKEIPIIIKADSTGGVESISHALRDLELNDKRFIILNAGVGDITESDANLARITGGWLIAFRVKMPGTIRPFLDQYRIPVDSFDLIYDLIDKAKKKLAIVDQPKEKLVNQAMILKVFRDDENEALVGVQVDQGTFQKGQSIEVFRTDRKIANGTIQSIKRIKSDINLASTGMEVGIVIRKSAILDNGTWRPQPDDIIRQL